MSIHYRNGTSKKVNKSSVSKQELHEHLEVNARQVGIQFFKSRRDHLKHTKGDGNAVIVTAYIQSQLRFISGKTKERSRLKRNGLWFRCPMNRIMRRTYMKEDKVRRCVKTLEAYEMIWTRKGHNNVLWVKVNHIKIDEIEREWIADEIEEKGTYEENQIRGNPRSRNGETPDLETGKPQISSNKNSSKKKKEEKSLSRFSISDDDFTSTEERHANETRKLVNGFHFGSDEQANKKSNVTPAKRYLLAHDKLRKILTEATPTRYVTNMSREAGAEHLRLLCEVNLRGDFSVIDDVLEDYAEYINDIPRPSIINAKQFREQFSWLQTEINKRKGDTISVKSVDNGKTYTGE